jgi:hypothetical protein
LPEELVPEKSSASVNGLLDHPYKLNDIEIPRSDHTVPLAIEEELGKELIISADVVSPNPSTVYFLSDHDDDLGFDPFSGF